MIPILIVLALSAAQSAAPTASELMARGSKLIGSKPADAVKLLQQALRLDPELPRVHDQLGLAYQAIGDEADAAAELREAVSRTPDSAEAHNYLGIALFRSGDAKASLDEFRAAAKLAPKDPNAHFNLGEALARTGESAAAVEELRVASQLAPGDAGLARLLTSVETALAPANTIKVEVKQVLVPVVVTDSQGHHISGLTQADFKIFEDGVEQKITAFSVESSGQPPTESPAPSAVSRPAAARATTPASAPAPKPRRTYMIVLDTLHTSFVNLASVREALVKLFQQEHSADSQYVMVALGVSPEMLLNVTRDPAAAIAVLSSKKLQKVYLDGQMGGLGGEMERFRRDLNDTRTACDVALSDSIAKVKCVAGLGRLPERARQIAEMDRTVTTGFLRQFRALVAQLAPARDRRTIVFVSDGFQIEPGREALTLANAYFPPASHCFVPPDIDCPANAMLSTARMADQFEPILKLAAAGNVTIDTIDSRGLYGQREFDAATGATSIRVDGAVSSVERTMAAAVGNTLAEIADATGGTAFHNNNNLFGGLQRAFADGRDYYMLAYVPANSNFDGTFRAINVQVRDSNAKVNAKRGYWSAQDAR